MNLRLTRPDHELTSRRGVRASLAALAFLSAAIGGFAALSPHGFYRHIAGVDRLGPYNEHLVSDVGGLYLGFALLFVWASLSLSRELARAVTVAFAFTQVVHFAYHLAHTGSLTSRQVIEQFAGLAPLLVLPLVALLLIRRTAS